MTHVIRWFLGVAAFVVGSFVMLFVLLSLGGLDPGYNLGIGDAFVGYLIYLGGALASGSVLALLYRRSWSSVVVLGTAVVGSAVFLLTWWLAGRDTISGAGFWAYLGVSAVLVTGAGAALVRTVERAGKAWRRVATSVLVVGLLGLVAVLTLSAREVASVQQADLEEEQGIRSISQDLLVVVEQCTRDEVSGTITNGGAEPAPIVEIVVSYEASDGTELEAGWSEVYDLLPSETREWRLFEGSGAMGSGIDPVSCVTEVVTHP